jgi:glycosyltransferase involved in cell wall biosynthesis
LEYVCELYPEAEIFTLLHLPGTVSPTIERHRITTSFIQRLPGVAKHYRSYLPLFPWAAESLDLREFDLVISLSHCVALGVTTGADTCHVAYLFTPMRYIWDLYRDYFGPQRKGPLTRAAISLFVPGLRLWDRQAGNRSDYICCISRHVARRISKHYGREAEVIYPPVDTEMFHPDDPPSGAPDQYYLIVSALSPYKRLDLAVEAFNRMGKTLVIIGTGPEDEALRAKAGPTISFLGHQSDEMLRRYYSGCKALIFPGEEDFGLVPLEVMACGRPVIALSRGGALETLGEGSGSVFFRDQSEESLIEAVECFEGTEPNPVSCRRHAEGFSVDQFKGRFRAHVKSCLTAFIGSE